MEHERTCLVGGPFRGELLDRLLAGGRPQQAHARTGDRRAVQVDDAPVVVDRRKQEHGEPAHPAPLRELEPHRRVGELRCVREEAGRHDRRQLERTGRHGRELERAVIARADRRRATIARERQLGARHACARRPVDHASAGHAPGGCHDLDARTPLPRQRIRDRRERDRRRHGRCRGATGHRDRAPCRASACGREQERSGADQSDERDDDDDGRLGLHEECSLACCDRDQRALPSRCGIIELGTKPLEPGLEPPAHGARRNAERARDLGGALPIEVPADHRGPERLVERDERGRQPLQHARAIDRILGGSVADLGRSILARTPSGLGAPVHAPAVAQHGREPRTDRPILVGWVRDRGDRGVLDEIIGLRVAAHERPREGPESLQLAEHGLGTRSHLHSMPRPGRVLGPMRSSGGGAVPRAPRQPARPGSQGAPRA